MRLTIYQLDKLDADFNKFACRFSIDIYGYERRVKTSDFRAQVEK